MSSTYSFLVAENNGGDTENSVELIETSVSYTWDKTATAAQSRMEAQTETITLDEAIDAVMSKAAAVTIAVDQATTAIKTIRDSTKRVTSPKSVDEAWGFMKEVVKHITTAWDKVWSATRALHTAVMMAEAEDNRDKWQTINEAQTAAQVVVTYCDKATRASETASEAWANIFDRAPANWDVAADPTEAAFLQADHPQTIAMSLIEEATRATNAAQETISKADQAWNEANAKIFIIASHHTRSTFAQAMVQVAAATKAVDEATAAIANAQIRPQAAVSWDKIKRTAETEVKVTTEAYDKILETMEACHAAYHMIQNLSQNREETWQVARQTAKTSIEDWEKARAATEASVQIWKQTSTQSDQLQPDLYAAHRSIIEAMQIADTAVTAISQATESWQKVNPKLLLAISNTTSTDTWMK
jgi:hypothetical protein